MTEARYNVVLLGGFPTTRSKGQEGRNRLEELARQPHVDLTVDFTGVEAMTISFVDEFLGRFLAGHDAGAQDATFSVTGLNTENLEAVTICLERREAHVVVINANGSRDLVGDSILSGTFEAIRDLNEFKANDAANLLHLSPQNANNRLKRLVAAGALRKSRSIAVARGGKEFVYQPVRAQLPNAATLTTV